MYTHFFLGVRQDMDIPGLVPVRYNIQEKIYALKYCHYKRISLEIVHDADHEPARMGLWWDDGRIADIRWYMEERLLRMEDGSLNYPAIYKTVLNALELLWRKKNWYIDDLNELYQVMESERFAVSVTYGKVMLSPDKSHKVDLCCELYPDYTDYYVCFSARRNKWRKMIKFLKGHEDPEVFFWFFANRYWRDNEHFIITDRDREIFIEFDLRRDDFTIEYRLQEHAGGSLAGMERGERMRLFGFTPLVAVESAANRRRVLGRRIPDQSTCKDEDHLKQSKI